MYKPRTGQLQVMVEGKVFIVAKRIELPEASGSVQTERGQQTGLGRERRGVGGEKKRKGREGRESEQSKP